MYLFEKKTAARKYHQVQAGVPELRPQVEHDGAGGHRALCGFGGTEMMTRCDM